MTREFPVFSGTQSYTFRVYICSIKIRNKAAEEPWISVLTVLHSDRMCRELGTTADMWEHCHLWDYMIMMAPSMAESCRTSHLPYLDAQVGSSSLVRVASSHINIKKADKQV